MEEAEEDGVAPSPHWASHGPRKPRGRRAATPEGGGGGLVDGAAALVESVTGKLKRTLSIRGQERAEREAAGHAQHTPPPHPVGLAVAVPHGAEPGAGRGAPPTPTGYTPHAKRAHGAGGFGPAFGTPGAPPPPWAAAPPSPVPVASAASTGFTPRAAAAAARLAHAWAESAHTPTPASPAGMGAGSPLPPKPKSRTCATLHLGPLQSRSPAPSPIQSPMPPPPPPIAVHVPKPQPQPQPQPSPQPQPQPQPAVPQPPQPPPPASPAAVQKPAQLPPPVQVPQPQPAPTHGHGTRRASPSTGEPKPEVVESFVWEHAGTWGPDATGVTWDERMLLHESRPEHPEQPGRLRAVFRRLNGAKLFQRVARIPSRVITDEELLLCHTETHVNRVDAAYDPSKEERVQGEGDMYFSAGTATAARLSAGCVLDATRAVTSGELSNAFALVRPPGHHAEKEEVMGFCMYANVVVAALDALATKCAERVLIVDWDVHHGNGTQNLLEDDPRVLYVSLHRYGLGFFPGTGAATEVGKGLGEGFSLNVPWIETGLTNADYIAAFDTVIMPVAAAFDPDLVLISAGFDAAAGDPLGRMRLSPAGYSQMTNALLGLAGGKCVVALEGGYSEQAVAASAEAVLRALLGEAPSAVSSRRLKPLTERTLRDVIEVQTPHWPCLGELDFRERVDRYFARAKAAAEQPSSKNKGARAPRSSSSRSRSASSPSTSAAESHSGSPTTSAMSSAAVDQSSDASDDETTGVHVAQSAMEFMRQIAQMRAAAAQAQEGHG